ncbi:aldo/keto reductase [Nodularia sp. LEGE 04288]|uniref:aldo/keto reductase n=1 Tax=unclassified Nodularia (in: cyanobacteria) TaxID=2656917 RepID=UPI001D11AD67
MQITNLAAPSLVSTNKLVSCNSQFQESDLPFYRKLGRTDLNVSCLGLGGGGSISSEDTLYAFEQGINYFFYSSDLHHHIYSSMSGGLRQLCGRGSANREKVVLATVTYIKNPDMALAALMDQFVELKLDYIDVFFWGWIDVKDESNFQDCLQLSHDLRGANSVYQRTIEKIFGISERLKKMGAVRYIGASFHDLGLAQKWSNSPLLDVVMVRHNMAHRSAQAKVFHELDPQDPQRPGIVTFKSTGSHSGVLWDTPDSFPEGLWQPFAPDCYRYSLTQNCVDVCLTGLRCREEIDAAIAGIKKGKLTSAELDYLAIYGDLHRQRLKIEDIEAKKLIYRSN